MSWPGSSGRDSDSGPPSVIGTVASAHGWRKRPYPISQLHGGKHLLGSRRPRRGALRFRRGLHQGDDQRNAGRLVVRGAGPPTVGGSCSPSPEESSTSSARMAADSGGSCWTPVPAAPSRSSRDGRPTASGSCFPWPCRAPATKRTSSRPEPTAPTSGGSPTRQTLRSSGTGAHLGDNVYRYGPWPPAAATGPERPGAISTRCPNAGPLPSDLSGARAGRGQGPAGIGRRCART